MSCWKKPRKTCEEDDDCSWEKRGAKKRCGPKFPADSRLAAPRRASRRSLVSPSDVLMRNDSPTTPPASPIPPTLSPTLSHTSSPDVLAVRDDSPAPTEIDSSTETPTEIDSSTETEIDFSTETSSPSGSPMSAPPELVRRFFADNAAATTPLAFRARSGGAEFGLFRALRQAGGRSYLVGVGPLVGPGDPQKLVSKIDRGFRNSPGIQGYVYQRSGVLNGQLWAFWVPGAPGERETPIAAEVRSALEGTAWAAGSTILCGTTVKLFDGEKYLIGLSEDLPNDQRLDALKKCKEAEAPQTVVDFKGTTFTFRFVESGEIQGKSPGSRRAVFVWERESRIVKHLPPPRRNIPNADFASQAEAVARAFKQGSNAQTNWKLAAERANDLVFESPKYDLVSVVVSKSEKQVGQIEEDKRVADEMRVALEKLRKSPVFSTSKMGETHLATHGHVTEKTRMEARLKEAVKSMRDREKHDDASVVERQKMAILLGKAGISPEIVASGLFPVGRVWKFGSGEFAGTGKRRPPDVSDPSVAARRAEEFGISPDFRTWALEPRFVPLKKLSLTAESRLSSLASSILVCLCRIGSTLMFAPSIRPKDIVVASVPGPPGASLTARLIDLTEANLVPIPPDTLRAAISACNGNKQEGERAVAAASAHLMLESLKNQLRGGPQSSRALADALYEVAGRPALVRSAVTSLAAAFKTPAGNYDHTPCGDSDMGFDHLRFSGSTPESCNVGRLGTEIREATRLRKAPPAALPA